jgi:hypothetical protein
VITNFVQKPSNQIFFGMTGFLWEIGKPDWRTVVGIAFLDIFLSCREGSSP